MSRVAAPVLVAAALTLGVAACGGAGDEKPGIEGDYAGLLQQPGLVFGVSVRIRDLKDPARNRVRYAGLGCSGTWAYLGRTGAAYRFRETIDRGRSARCKGTGTVTLTPDGETPDGHARLRYRFRGGGIESRGQLQRQD